MPFHVNINKLNVFFLGRHLDALDDDTTVTIVDFGTNDGRNIFPFMKIMIGKKNLPILNFTVKINWYLMNFVEDK